MTETAREVYRIGLPSKGKYRKIFDSDEKQYFGSDYNQQEEITAEKEPWQHRAFSAEIKLSPLGLMMFKKSK